MRIDTLTARAMKTDRERIDADEWVPPPRYLVSEDCVRDASPHHAATPGAAGQLVMSVAAGRQRQQGPCCPSLQNGSGSSVPKSLDTKARAVMSGPRPLRLCHFGSFSLSQAYSRNICIARALKTAGWTVLECRSGGPSPTWHQARSWVTALGPLAAAYRVARNSFRLTLRHARTPPYDLLLVGYPAHIDVFLAAVLAKWRRRPLVIDAFIGLYDTVVTDRALISERSILARFLRCWEWLALHLPDAVLVDTEEHADLLAREYKLPRGRFIAVPVGIDERIWRPEALPDHDAEFRVAFWSTFIPLHGATVVARAAAAIDKSGERVRFDIVGDGQTADAFAAALGELRPRNVVWRRELLSMNEIVALARQAHCCLGIMGTTGKAARVVPYKVYQALASARPVVTADTPAARRLLTDGESALLVRAGDPAALAEAIMRLAHDRRLCERLAQGGRKAYENRLSERRMSETLDRELRRITQRSSGGGAARTTARNGKAKRPSSH